MFRLELIDVPCDSDPGGVHEHIESSVLRAVLLDQAPAVRGVRNVGSDGVRAECLGGSLDLRPGPRSERQGEAVLPQHARDREPNTRGTSGDERCPFHQAIFSSREGSTPAVQNLGRGGTERLLLSPESRGGTAWFLRGLFPPGERE